MKKTILVTGGAGYIGAHTVAELIAQNYDVVIVDNLSVCDETLLLGIELLTKTKPSFYPVDCNDFNSLQNVFKLHQIDAVIHFAAFKAVGESTQKPLVYHYNNVGSLITLLRVMEEFKVKDFIFSSSCTVYGQPDVIPVTEEAPIKKAESPYGATKQICEQIIKDVTSQNLKAISLRYFNPIGAHPSAELGELPIGTPNNLVPFITQTAAGVRQQLTVFGTDYPTRDGSCIRDYIHVVDLAKAHVAALAYLLKQSSSTFLDIFNVGTGEGKTVLEVIEAFERINQITLNYTKGPRRPGDVIQVFADTTYITKKLGWKPEYTLEDALQHAWQWEKKIRKRQ